MNDYWLQDKQVFVERYGALYEHSPWIAEDAWEALQAERIAKQSAPSLDINELLQAMGAAVTAAGKDSQLTLIRAHPDLAGRAAVAGELTDHSSEEQASARLDQCSKEEYELFHSNNRAYKDKFGFPFVMAVRNRSRAEILEAFSSRINNSPEQEFSLAIDNIHQIARLRLEAEMN